MKNLILSLTFLFIGMETTFASQCGAAQKEALKLEKMVSEVYFVSESDDTWKAFSSTEAVTAITASEIRRVLNLGETYDEEPSFFSLEGYSEVYRFIRGEIEAYSEENYNEPESQAKLKRLISTISKTYGKNVRMVMFGQGDGDAFFVGKHMIVLIDENGCVLGLEAFTVWT